jgi:TolA-binding protein
MTKFAETKALEAEGATDAMESMRKDMSELVEVEIAEKEAEFEKIEADYARTKEKVKENKAALEEAARDRNKRIDQLNKEKKIQKQINFDLNTTKRRLQELESELKKKKQDEKDSNKELEKVIRENERVKDDLAGIQMNYDLDTIEDKFRSAKKTEEWAELFYKELEQLFNSVE